jgi:hypothetical protein
MSSQAAGWSPTPGVGRVLGGEVGPGVAGGLLDTAVGVGVCPGDPDAVGPGGIDLFCPPILCVRAGGPNPPLGDSGLSRASIHRRVASSSPGLITWLRSIVAPECGAADAHAHLMSTHDDPEEVRRDTRTWPPAAATRPIDRKAASA